MLYLEVTRELGDDEGGGSVVAGTERTAGFLEDKDGQDSPRKISENRREAEMSLEEK